MRGLVPDLDSAHPLLATLPALYADDDLLARFLQAFDDCLAPVITTLDCLPAYLDPQLTPSDFLAWLAGWLGVALDEAAPLERQRQVVAQAVDLYRWRGTRAGLSEQVRVVTGVLPEVQDSGGVSWSSEPEGVLPGSAVPDVVVRLRVPEPGAVDQRRVEAVIAAAAPAHVPHALELLQDDAGGPSPDRPRLPEPSASPWSRTTTSVQEDTR